MSIAIAGYLYQQGLIDENANHKNVWQEYFSCYTYAGSSSYRQKEKQSAGITVTEDGLVFTARYCSELSHLDSTHFRVRFKGETYNITSVDMMNYQSPSRSRVRKNGGTPDVK